MKHIITIIAIMALSVSTQAQITFTSDSTFQAKDTSWIQLDTIAVGNATWYQLTQISFDRNGNRVITSYAPQTKRMMREYARTGRDQANQSITAKATDLQAARAQRDVYLAILNALKE